MAAHYQITIDGKDVSDDLDPILISLTIELSDDDEADSLQLDLDDTDGQIELPAKGASVSASIWTDDKPQTIQFDGYTDEAKSSGTTPHGHHRGHGGTGAQDLHSLGSRSGGRTLTLSAKSADVNGKLKSRMSRHFDNMSFSDVAQQIFSDAGLSAKVTGTLSSIQRAYWGIFNESPMLWGTRMARELGATFKVMGGSAVFVPRAGGQSYDGQDLTGITAAWGVNLLGWSISPVVSRPTASTFKARYYDPQKAEHGTEQADNSDDGGGDSEGADDADHTDLYKSPDKDHAKQVAGSNAAESKRESGSGDTVTIDGEPAAQPSASCTVSGIRPGVDGSYLISRVTQTLSRGSGLITQLTLKQPSDGAGTDSRASSPVTPQPLTPEEQALPDTSSGPSAPAGQGGIGSQ